MSETEQNVATEGATKVFKGTIENAYGRKLSANKFKDGKTVVDTLDYTGSYEHLESYAEVPADEKLKEADMLDVVNNARKANARQKAMQKALDEAGVIKPTMEDDDELKIASIVKGLVASKKYDDAQARQLAKQMLGIA
jgi:hypothetical protein